MASLSSPDLREEGLVVLLAEHLMKQGSDQHFWLGILFQPSPKPLLQYAYSVRYPLPDEWSSVVSGCAPLRCVGFFPLSFLSFLSQPMEERVCV